MKRIVAGVTLLLVGMLPPLLLGDDTNGRESLIIAPAIDLSLNAPSIMGQRPEKPPRIALPNIFIGVDDTAVGFGSLSNTTGEHMNSAFGANSLFSNTTGVRNVAVGWSALYSNTTGGGNVAVGWSALYSNTTGGVNVAIGREALYRNTDGAFNIAIGGDALHSHQTGDWNIAIGFQALEHSGSSRNLAIGNFALQLLSGDSDNNNIAIGSHALINLRGGNQNIALGRVAGAAVLRGDDNIYIGNGGGPSPAPEEWDRHESNTIRIGTDSSHLRTFIAGVYGATLEYTTLPVYIDEVGQLGTIPSARAFKEDIQDMGGTSDRLLDLRPVTFRYKQESPRENHVKPVHFGLIAEEVAEIYPELVGYNKKGEPFTVLYHELPAMLLNELQKQQNKISEISLELQRQADVIAALEARLEALEDSKK